MNRDTLAQRQAELVRSLVGGAPTSDGFAEPHLAATRRALLRKRADDVARVWPHLAASHATRWRARFAAWAAGRPPQGSLLDGLEFARAHPPTGPAGIELMVHTSRLRRLPSVRIGHGVIVVQLAGRVRVLPLPRRRTRPLNPRPASPPITPAAAAPAAESARKFDP